MERLIVTGVGTREIQQDAHQYLVRLGGKLARDGWMLRSGGANGCDISFEIGWEMENQQNNMEIYLPWPRFNKAADDPFHPVPERDYHAEIWMEAEDIAQMIHPAWERLNEWSRKLHTRNVFQVLGPDLNRRSDLLVCIAEPNGRGGVKGGTATAWQLAKDCLIPCFNLWYRDERIRLKQHLAQVVHPK